MPLIGDGTAQAIHSFAIAHAWLTPVVVVATAVCIALCPLALVILWIRDRTLRAAVATLLGLTVADKLCRYLGQLQYVQRPFVALHFTPLFPHTNNNSFPSSTVAFAAVVASIVLLAWRPAGVVLAIGTVIIAVGCVYVGVHYIEDVIVGAVLGIACGAVFWFALGPPPVGRFLGAIEERLPGARFTTPRTHR
ncbi:MAG TPA: phosphatase PAP2 family protein [Candidatus Acidoferrales bacterium]|nr:phosphatase PAP2 family protein [Candidatus Acidoferrales bacterium]